MAWKRRLKVDEAIRGPRDHSPFAEPGILGGGGIFKILTADAPRILIQIRPLKASRCRALCSRSRIRPAKLSKLQHLHRRCWSKGI